MKVWKTRSTPIAMAKAIARTEERRYMIFYWFLSRPPSKNTRIMAAWKHPKNE